MPYERYETRRRGYGASSQRTTLGYWVPLAITVTVASAGLVAWIWKERKDSEEYQDRPSRPPGGYSDAGPGQPPYQQGPPGSQYQGPPGTYPGLSGSYQGPSSSFQGPPGSYPGPQYDGSRQQQQEDPSVISRVQDVLRRTPSPQQFFDQASRRVTAGVAAAGAVVGNALSSIREEKGDYEDHSRWSEEAEVRGRDDRPAQTNQATTSPKPDKRKIVAIVVSAEAKSVDTEDTGYSQAHASMLSHLPEDIYKDARVFVLIYSPDLKQQTSSSQGAKPSSSIASSYSNIGHEDLQTPGEEGDKPLTTISPQPVQHSSLYDVLYAQAQAFTDKESMIMPFSTPSAYVQMLRQISPQVVYVQSNLSGDQGEAVKNISGWVGQVILVVGDESGHGGLVDSEDERGAHGDDDGKAKWWTNDPKIGLGQIEVVEGLRFGEDWRRRVRGHD